ncbi:preprotein translocase subunit SecE [Gilliamella sp. Pra-s65]|uniref:preprotein translocase subunit SecE n=1 Tax=unclassified Gilliamella TaxID=2685620 RepID=UPI001324C49A|nr:MULTISPECIES: preprotein translocase subunit SecE [unclassified Gilliamella]MWN32926.1 preprotein translocase subunit SecE [Gilliamella sp. Pra-s60]MWN89107.1 preprotein translocase subunit SecE [Gilliamella sp. Pra-s65]MWP30374.1 preprotein translocase subunit SecE [Gilliamella sp. Pra-s54]MWP47165.1 preprotein translocase subunit SecE [Gilliamella sp. Pas-s27]MWP72150.1 preprotein translocase subunit SecE [Gilliamella sp. Pra-s52]
MLVSNENQDPNTILDKFRWGLVLVLIAFVVWGNFYFSEPNDIYQPNSIVRIIAVVIISLLALFIAITTRKGKLFLSFLQESRKELRKVVWPTRKETTQTTLLIAAITIVVGLALWGMDSFFRSVIFYLTSIGR